MGVVSVGTLLSFISLSCSHWSVSQVFSPYRNGRTLIFSLKIQTNPILCCSDLVFLFLRSVSQIDVSSNLFSSKHVSLVLSDPRRPWLVFHRLEGLGQEDLLFLQGARSKPVTGEISASLNSHVPDKCSDFLV